MRAFVRIIIGLFALALIVALESVAVIGAKSGVLALVWNSGYHYECTMLYIMTVFYVIFTCLFVGLLWIYIDEEIVDSWRN